MTRCLILILPHLFSILSLLALFLYIDPIRPIPNYLDTEPSDPEKTRILSTVILIYLAGRQAHSQTSLYTRLTTTMARLHFGAAFCLALWWSSGVQATQIHNNPIACAVSLGPPEYCELALDMQSDF